VEQYSASANRERLFGRLSNCEAFRSRRILTTRRMFFPSPRRGGAAEHQFGETGGAEGPADHRKAPSPDSYGLRYGRRRHPRRPRAGHGGNQIRPAGRMAGVDDDRQMARPDIGTALMSSMLRSNPRRSGRRGSTGDVRVALREQYSADSESFTGAHGSLKRRASWPDPLLEQIEVCILRRRSEHVSVFFDEGICRGSITSVTTACRACCRRRAGS